MEKSVPTVTIGVLMPSVSPRSVISVRTMMTDRGEQLGISTPIVTVGTDFSTAALRDVSQAVCPFKMGPHSNLFVYLVLQGRK